MSNVPSDSITLNDKKKKFRMPGTPALLLCITLFVAILTYVLPAGEFDRAEMGDRTVVVPGTFHAVEGNPCGIGDLFSSVFNGLVNAAELIAFVFVVGGAFYIVQSTGAINAGLGALIRKLGGGKEFIMIIVVMVAFSLGGASFGMAEETLPFVALCVLAAQALGYDTIVGISMVLIGVYCGYSAGPLNPFNTGIAQSICELPTFSGIGLRIVLMIGTLVIAITYTLIYAKRHRGGDQLGDKEIEKARKEAELLEMEFTKLHKVVLIILGVTLLSLVFGVIKFGWYFAEISALFMAMGVIVGMIYYRGSFNKTMDIFMDGAKAMTIAALIMGLSRTILVVAENGMILDTIVYGISIPLGHMPETFTACGMYVAQGIINFLIPSSSGQAVVVMPIMSSVSDLVGVSRQTAVLAFTCGDGFWNMITPTHSVVMATLGIAGMSFGKWFKFALPLVLIWSVWICIILVFATVTGYGPF